MSEKTPAADRVVWFDIPVVDLARANAFYAGVLNIEVQTESFGDVTFCVLEHGPGNGGCLILRPDEVTGDKGPLLYLNVDGRLRAAVTKVGELGGSVKEDVHAIGPHGFRAIVLDSEGNRVALHSESDA